MEVSFSDFLNILTSWGWVVAPILLFLLWKELWMNYIKLKYDLSLNWVVLEIKFPQVVDQSPKSMEQVFAGLYSIKSGANLIEKYIQGKHQPEISLEIVSIQGAIHFFVRTPDQYASLIRSQIHAQYHDADIQEVDDYTFNLPVQIPNEEYDLWGTELIFTKEDAYPIRTYKHFKEEITADVQGRYFVDPMASLIEVLSDIGEGEQIWIHYMIRPASDYWQKKGKDLIARIMGTKKKKTTSNVPEEVFEFFQDLIGVFFGKVPENRKKVSEEKKEEKKLTPGELEVIKIIEDGLDKQGFHTNIRILYIAKRDKFSRAIIPAILGTFNQFSSSNLNGFRPNPKVTPGVNYFFVKTRDYLRKRNLYRKARRKLFVGEGIILNTEELATVYHIPNVVVETPSLPKVEAKKVQPPSELPTL